MIYLRYYSARLIAAGQIAGDGGAIEIVATESSELTLNQVIARDNSSNGAGGVIGGYLQANFILSISDSNFTLNEGGFIGGAVGLVLDTSNIFLNVFIENSHFSFNQVALNTPIEGLGGAVGVYLTSASTNSQFIVDIQNSIFNDNTAITGGAVALQNQTSSFNAVINNSRFTDNIATTAGALFVSSPGANNPGLIEVKRSSFVSNSNFVRGAVNIGHINLNLLNNLFLQNDGNSNTGGLQLNYDQITQNVDVDVRANTFYENTGNPKDLNLIMPQGGSSNFEANVVKGIVDSTINCLISNVNTTSYNTTNLSNSPCAPGANSVSGVDLMLQSYAVNHAVHQFAAIPEAASPIVDIWPDINCHGPDGFPLQVDQLDQRRDTNSGLPPDGSGNGVNACDAGAIEIDELLQMYTLDVELTGNGTGIVESNPAGIDCPATCDTDYGVLTMVTLTETASPGSIFTGWGGACSGVNTCEITMISAQQVTAEFYLDEIFSNGFE